MNNIILTESIASHPSLERLNLFAGRHMGEEEFDRSQAYMDQRISSLLSSFNPGIVNGLNVRISPLGSDEGFTINPGLALAGNGQSLGLYYPLRQNWQTLIESYLDETQAADAAGVFYLTFRRREAYVDADPTIDPCQRAEFDPTRDAQRVLVGTVGLTRLGIEPSMVTTTRQALIENWVAANNVGGEFLATISTAVPLGLLAVENMGNDVEGNPIYQVRWFSEAAGRYSAVADSGYHVLLQQVNQAFQRVLLNADSRPESTSLQDFIRNNLTLDFLPSSGEIPKELIGNIASTSPTISWFPSHLAIDMVAMPEDSIAEMLERHLPRRVVDLRHATSDRLRLILAISEKEFKRNLLDYPQTDKKLESDIFWYFQRAYRVWSSWTQKYQELYFIIDDEILEPEDLKVLDLPEAISAPQLPQDFYDQVIAESAVELGLDEEETHFYPYNAGRPNFPAFYQNWGVISGSGSNINVLPPVVEEPQIDGLVIRYAISQHELESIDNQIRATRSRLEKTRDYLLLQRQQLDNQTVSMAALAGGVAGDGSGLQVARWLPFTQLKAIPLEVDSGGDGGTSGGEQTPATPLFKAIQPSYMTFAGKIAASSIAKTASFASPTSSRNFVESTGLLSSNHSNFATANSNLLFASTLRKTPTIFSTLQFNLNNNRLDKIAEAPKQALTKPAFEAKEFRFGTLEHVRPEIQEYKKAFRGMRELITTLTELFDTNEANSLKKILESYGAIKSLDDLALPEKSRTQEELEQAAVTIYQELFSVSKILTHQIAYMEGRYNRVEALLEGRLRARINKEAQIEKLIALIKKASEELESIDKQRAEYLGDYGVAQRLLDDDWLTVYQNNKERTRILTSGVKGVYYVRERQSSVSKSLADPLLLRHGSAKDIIPGCDWDIDPELPDELDDFYELVLEIPMSDWSALKDLHAMLPPTRRLEYIEQIRNVRLASKTSQKRKAANVALKSTRSVKASLYGVRLQSQSLMAQIAQLAFPLQIASAKQRVVQTAQVMSLEDLVSGAKGKLQNEAQILSRRLEQAVYCLLEKLNELPPSLRLQWAQMAEDDRLMVANVERWPGLERAERDDFNATRTVAELVEWWFRQLDKDASATGKTAMHNMIRATLIQSALGDPAEILQGQVQVPPRSLLKGEPLRLKLNRPVVAGTNLQLMDPQQRIVAMLKVEDDDDKGTIANIVQVTKANAIINTQYRVVASKATRQLVF